MLYYIYSRIFGLSVHNRILFAHPDRIISVTYKIITSTLIDQNRFWLLFCIANSVKIRFKILLLLEFQHEKENI